MRGGIPIAVMAVSGLILSAGLSIEARGQTAPGDILRGEGAFLRGKGLYDYYSAQGRRIDAGTDTALLARGVPAFLRICFCRLRLHPRRVDRLLSQRLYLPDAVGPLGQ